MDAIIFDNILNRDQRTAKNFIYNTATSDAIYFWTKSSDEQDNMLFRTNDDDVQLSVGIKRRKIRNKGRFMWHHQRFLRLKHALLFGAYLCLVTLPSIIAAPLNMSRTNSRPWWINPIGLCNTNGATSQVPTKDMLSHIVNQSKLALGRAEKSASTFVKETFNGDTIDNIHSMFKDTDYDWLPTKHLPKNLNEYIHDPQHLKCLKVDTALVEAYSDLQRIAVGLEQISWDQEDQKGPLRKLMNSTCDDLRVVLSEIQTTICETNLNMPENIDRDIMDPQHREITSMTDINIRDWVIFRDYIIMLKSIIEIFSYLENNA